MWILVVIWIVLEKEMDIGVGFSGFGFLGFLVLVYVGRVFWL